MKYLTLFSRRNNRETSQEIPHYENVAELRLLSMTFLLMSKDLSISSNSNMQFLQSALHGEMSLLVATNTEAKQPCKVGQE